ncbi:hypothetical protein D3C87_501000 [compost metagenome]
MFGAAAEFVLVPAPGGGSQNRVGDRNAELAARRIAFARAAGTLLWAHAVKSAVVKTIVRVNAILLLARLQHPGESHGPGRQIEQITVDRGVVTGRHRFAALGQVAAKLLPFLRCQRPVETRGIRSKHRVTAADTELRAKVEILNRRQWRITRGPDAAIFRTIGRQIVAPTGFGDLVRDAEGAGPRGIAPLAVVAGAPANFFLTETAIPALQIAAVLVDEVR